VTISPARSLPKPRALAAAEEARPDFLTLLLSELRFVIELEDRPALSEAEREWRKLERSSSAARRSSGRERSKGARSPRRGPPSSRLDLEAIS
jgi:hypothetical protein